MPKVTEQHRQDRRAQILRAAVRCFARQGFHRTSMADIIEKSGLSAGAIYQYFASKEKIIEAIAAERHAEETALIRRLLVSEELGEGLGALAREFFEMLKRPGERERRKVTVQVWAEALRNKEIMKIVQRGLNQRDLVTESLGNAQAKGLLPRDLEPEALARVMVAILQGFVLQQAWDPTISADDYLAAVLYLIESAFGFREGHSQSLERTKFREG